MSLSISDDNENLYPTDDTFMLVIRERRVKMVVSSRSHSRLKKYPMKMRALGTVTIEKLKNRDGE